MTARVPALVVAAFLLLGTAWLVGNPPGAAPDEPAHYLKALAAGRGQLYLGRTPPRPANYESLPRPERWLHTTSRLVHVPAGMAPSALACNAFEPEVTSACLEATPPPSDPMDVGTVVGPYQPYTYVLPGLLVRLASDPETGVRMGRLGFWLVSAALLALAVHLVWSPGDGAWSLLGLLVATTPMVLFMVSVVSANGLEIAAGLCLGSALLRLTRPDPPRWAWTAAGVSGTALALSRVTGVVWLGLLVLSAVALAGRREAGTAFRRAGRRAVVAATAIGVAVVATVAWEVVVQPRPQRSLGAAVRDLPREVGDLPYTYRQVVGLFGWLDTALPLEAFWAWNAVLLTLLALALLVGSRRQRLVVAGLVVAAVAATVALATVNRPTGFGMQARYVLPFLVMVPLAAGEVVCANRARLPAVLRRLLVPGTALAVAGVHVVAWFFNGRRYAVGTAGPRWFLGQAEWSPPLGWVPWLAATVAAGVLLVGAAVAASRHAAPPPSRHAAPPPNRQTPPC